MGRVACDIKVDCVLSSMSSVTVHQPGYNPPSFCACVCVCAWERGRGVEIVCAVFCDPTNMGAVCTLIRYELLVGGLCLVRHELLVGVLVRYEPAHTLHVNATNVRTSG